MKKLLAAFFIGLATVTGASAQDIFDNPENHAYLGVRAGLDLTCPGNVKSDFVSVDLFNVGAGFDAGVIYNIPLWKNLYFEPGLKLYYSTMGVDVEAGDASGMYPADVSVRRFGFRIPFRVGYRFDFDPVSVSVFTGPQLEIGLVGRTHYNTKVDGHSASDSENAFDDFHRVNMGWQFGAGVNYGKWTVELCGAAGMLDLNPSDASFHQGNVCINLGYNF